jgi:hypothetical protein
MMRKKELKACPLDDYIRNSLCIDEGKVGCLEQFSPY